VNVPRLYDAKVKLEGTGVIQSTPYNFD